MMRTEMDATSLSRIARAEKPACYLRIAGLQSRNVVIHLESRRLMCAKISVNPTSLHKTTRERQRESATSAQRGTSTPREDYTISALPAATSFALISVLRFCSSAGWTNK